MPPANRRSSRAHRLGVALVLILGCAEHVSETPTAPSPAHAAESPAPSSPAAPPAPAEPPAAPEPPASPTPPVAVPAEPEPSVFREPTEAERLQAYVADCSHVFEAVDEEFAEEPDATRFPECELIPFDQNCVPDPSGCWDDGQACIRECTMPCTQCQDTCSTTCDQCKIACPDEADDCIRTCAQARLECRSTCMTAKTRCQEVDCRSQEKECNESFDAKRKKRCPKCKEITHCLTGADEDDYVAACRREFPRARKECFEWCMEYL